MGINNKLLAVLFISLGVNIFAGGIFVGRVVNSHGISMERPRMFDKHRDGDRDGRGKYKRDEEIMKLSHEIAKEVKADIKTIKKLKYNALQAIEKEPFDKVAVKAALKDLRDGLGAAQEKMHEKLVDKAADMPADKRTSLLKTMCRGKLDMYRKYRKHLQKGDRGEMRERMMKRLRQQNGGEERGRMPRFAHPEAN